MRATKFCADTPIPILIYEVFSSLTGILAH